MPIFIVKEKGQKECNEQSGWSEWNEWSEWNGWNQWTEFFKGNRIDEIMNDWNE